MSRRREQPGAAAGDVAVAVAALAHRLLPDPAQELLPGVGNHWDGVDPDSLPPCFLDSSRINRPQDPDLVDTVGGGRVLDHRDLGADHSRRPPGSLLTDATAERHAAQRSVPENVGLGL